MTQELKTELKPCPFCGSKAKMLFYTLAGQKTRYFVDCSECHAETHFYTNTRRPKYFWNRRVSDSNETITSQLKSCPFCGGKAEIHHFLDNFATRYTVRCQHCHISTHDYSETKTPIKQWNMRANDGTRMKILSKTLWKNRIYIARFTFTNDN